MTGGPFAGFMAMVAVDSGSSVTVWHEVFGKQFKAHYDPMQMEPA